MEKQIKTKGFTNDELKLIDRGIDECNNDNKIKNFRGDVSVERSECYLKNSQE